MKPFKINRNSWHYKLNEKFMQDTSMQYLWEPKHSDFCSYWRATVLRLIVAAFCLLVMLTVLTLIGVAVYMDPISSLAIVAASVGVIASVVGIVVYLDSRKKKEPSQSLIAQKYRAHKEKICPMVEYD